MKFKPEVREISVADIISGDAFINKQLWLPTVQRDFVWSERRVADFFDSLYNGYPVGAITIIKTNHDFPKVPFEGNQIEDKGGEKYYVLDGQQRLTSLFLLKNDTKNGKWYIKRGDDEITRTYIGCNPDEKIVKFEVRRGYDIGLLLRKVANSELDIKDEVKKEKLMDIAKSILRYRLPVIYIELSIENNDDEGEIYEKIANMFVRINSAGMRLGSIDLFFSFFAGSYDEIRKKVKELSVILNNKYGIDYEPFLRVIFWSYGLNQSDFQPRNFKKALTKIKEKYNESEDSKKQMIDNIYKCYNSVEKTIELLYENLGKNVRKYLISQNVMVPLFAYAFKNDCQIPRESREKVIAWFILASFYSAYSQSTNTKIQEDLEKIDESEKGDFPLRGVIGRGGANIKRIYKKDIVTDDFINPSDEYIDIKKGKNYLFLLYSLLQLNKGTDLSGNLIGDCNNLVIHHIFPREFLEENIEKIKYEDSIEDICNLTFISEDANQKISSQSPEEYFGNYDYSILQKHFIPKDKKIYNVKEYLSFLYERGELIYEAVEEFVNNKLK